jgi:hypothetical protein
MEPGPKGSVRTSGAVPSASSPVSQAAQAIEVHQAEKLQAPQHDVVLAKDSVPVEQRPDPAAKGAVDDLWKAMRLSSANGDGRDHVGHDWNSPDAFRGDRGEHDWDHRVRQWDRDWVHYDDYYRPVICNPYRDTLRVVYIYQNAPRILVIPALASIVLDVAEYGAYNFTAVLLNTVGAAVNVAVGSFFGGGYFPGPDLPPPPPPPPLVTYDDVPIMVRYSDAAYDPFVVRRIVDVGDDARYGEHKVLLDGVTPVWGVWTQNADGQRQFEVHKAQQFPGMDDPRAGPLPGDYQLRLASNPSSAFSTGDVFVIAAGAVVATLGLCGAVALAIFRRRPRALH